MSVTRKNECIGGGYIASHLVELWGEPLSVRRLEMCDNEVRGIPADQSKQGNIICKLSPYVGVVNQRYVQGPGPTPEDKHIIGCEYAVYAWGWKKPEGENLQGKDYAEWFRNGELRLTRWLNLSNETMEVPAPDNHTWWNSQCEAAWHQKTNWLYNGIYRVGASIYSETLKLPTKMSVVVTSSGGYLTSTIDGTKYYFPSDTFTGTSIVTHTILSQSEMDFYEDVVVPINPGSATFLIGDRLRGIHHFFELTGVYSDTHLPSKFTQPCSVTIHYTDNDIHGVAENTLMLYYKNSDSWKVETSTHVFTENNTIVAQISNFSLWGVFGRTYRVYLPLIFR
jgi:hypothetical protein